MSTMANQIERWLSKKKNRKFLFFILGVIVLFFFVRNKGKTSEYGGSEYSSPPPPSTGTGGSTGVVPYPTGSGAITPKLAEFGDFEHLDWEWSGVPGDWSGRDKSTVAYWPGYQYRYMIAGEQITTPYPLDGYKWESNNAVTIHKLIGKNGVTDFYFWARNADDPTRRPDDGQAMSGNTSVAYQTWIFTRD